MAERIKSPAELLSATQELFNNTKIKSIRVARAKFLDSEDPNRIYGLRLPVEAAETIAPVPFDIDDLDLSDDKILELINNPATSNETLKNIRDVIRRIMIDQKANVLHWEGTTKVSYREKLREFIVALRAVYKERNKKLFQGISNIRNLPRAQQEAELENLFLIQDLTKFSSITKYVRNMSFNNELTLSVSLTELREQGVALKFIPKENDVLQMILEYPDGRTERFLGLISGVSDIEAYGQLTSLSLIVFGFSKILSINKMVTDRAVISQFAGEITEQLVTTWSTNAFAASSISEIFLSIMVNQMAMKPKILGDTAPDIILSIERSFILRTLIPRIDARLTLLRPIVTKTRGKLALGLVDRFIQQNSQGKNGLEKIVRRQADKINAVADTIDSLLNGIIQIRNRFGEIQPPDNEDLNKILDLTLLRDQLNKRVSNIAEEIGAPVFTDAREITIEFEFDPDAFTTLFQEIYVPLITMAALRLRQDETKIVARFRGKTALAFDVSTRSAYRLFFSQLNTAMSLLDSVKKTAKFFVYENEDNEIICEMPRYNEFVADTDKGEILDDFIIANPLHSEIGRQDMNLIGRIDTKMYVLIAGAFPFPLTSRQYTDPSVLGRYGLRVMDPVHNPNARTPAVAALYSALEVTEHNALTRILTVNVAGNRKYKLGRLYFVARKSLDQKVGQEIEVTGSSGEEKVVAKILEEIPLDGYVGYLDSIETTTNYGGVIEHQLSFTYVRKSRLILDGGIVRGANFKILPDISALIDALDAGLKSGDIPQDELEVSTQTLDEEAEADQIESPIGTVYVTPDITTADTENAIGEEIELKEVFPLHSEDFVPYKTFFTKGVV